MKLLHSLFCLLLILTSCTDESAIDQIYGVDSNAKLSMKINETKYKENISSGNIKGLTWNENSEGHYTISGYIEEIPLPIGIRYINIPLGFNIKIGQLIDIDTNPDNPYSFPNLFLIGGVAFSNNQYSFLEGHSSGQLKITHFDGITMSGEFSFSNIIYRTDEYAPVDTNHYNNTIVGSFKSIERNN